MVNTCAGLATLVGSVLVSLAPPPRSRVRVICNTLLFSMSTENLVLALGRTPLAWCIGAILGWIFIPVMNANMDALLRSYIPVEVQGRVYSARNTLQFFTIPLGYFLGGLLVDAVLEPLMASQATRQYTCRFSRQWKRLRRRHSIPDHRRPRCDGLPDLSTRSSNYGRWRIETVTARHRVRWRSYFGKQSRYTTKKTPSTLLLQSPVSFFTLFCYSPFV